MASFGLQDIDDSKLEDLYLTMGPMRPVVTQMVTRKAYHQDRGICTHQTDDPLDLVRLHPKEDIIEGGPLRTWQRKYANYRIKDVWGVSVLEFFELAFDEARFYVEYAQATAVQETINANSLMRTLT